MTKYLSFDPAIKTLAYTNITIENNKPKLNDFGLIDLTKNKKVKSCSFDDNISELIIQLDKIKIDNINLVLIENIPSRMNPIIKSISVAIYTYYKIKNMEVKFVSPSKKLKNNKVSYKERKKQSIIDAKEYLLKEDYDLISKYKKVDDITDTILQTKAYYEKNNK